MCGRYLIEEEAYSDILEILYRSGALSPIERGTGDTGDGNAAEQAILPVALKEAVASAMQSRVQETVPMDAFDLYRNTTGAAVVTNGEIFPTNIAPVLVSGDNGAALLTWGFPHWKNSSVIINARAETALEKQMFRKALLERRCVIPSGGYFEWGAGKLNNLQIGMLGTGTHENVDFTQKRMSKKTKYLLRRPDERKLYMAGFWSTFRDNGGKHCAFVILTTAASGSVAHIHDRMPLILSPDETDDWLAGGEFMQYALLRPGPELVAKAVE